MEMEKPKSDRQIEAEFNLANDPTELNLYTTTKTGTPPAYDTAYDSQIEKYVWMILCWELSAIVSYILS